MPKTLLPTRWSWPASRHCHATHRERIRRHPPAPRTCTCSSPWVVWCVRRWCASQAWPGLGNSIDKWCWRHGQGPLVRARSFTPPKTPPNPNPTTLDTMATTTPCVCKCDQRAACRPTARGLAHNECASASCIIIPLRQTYVPPTLVLISPQAETYAPRQYACTTTPQQAGRSLGWALVRMNTARQGRIGISSWLSPAVRALLMAGGDTLAPTCSW